MGEKPEQFDRHLFYIFITEEFTSATLCACRLLSTMARGASDNFLAKARALATPPTSGDTTTKSSEHIVLLAR